MRQFGLIGYPLAHSFSAQYFANKFKEEGIADAEYHNYELQSIEKLPALLAEQPELVGLNVTIPYKQAVIPYLDALDETAQAIGAVNTIVISDQLTGYNTDALGFESSLLPLLQPHHTHALVLGTGGASRAVLYVLDKLNIQATTVSRSEGKGHTTYDALTEEKLATHTLIVNCTPLGTALPNPEASGRDEDACPPLPYQHLSGRHLLYDLVYNPTTTLFMQKGREQGTAVKNGLEMLHQQAEASWGLWKKH